MESTPKRSESRPGRDFHAQTKGPGGLAGLFDVHPFFHPRRYVDWKITPASELEVQLELAPCWATDHPDDYSWLAVLAAHGPEPIEVVARAFDPRAGVEQTGDWAYRIVVDPAAAAAPEPRELDLMRLSTGAAFRFADEGGGDQ